MPKMEPIEVVVNVNPILKEADVQDRQEYANVVIGEFLKAATQKVNKFFNLPNTK